MRPHRCFGFTPLVVAALLCARPASAQFGLWPADSLLADGRLAAAESVYYAVARQHPRDPLARAALGRFLAARGGTRAGAVLLEEARFFGGDSAALARSLVPLYTRLGDYQALASLRPQVLSQPERRRVRWLAANRPQARFRDTVAVMTYRPLGDGQGFGTVILRLGKTELPAVIDPRVSGLVVPAAVRRDIRAFGTQGKRIIGVADTVRIGGIAFSNVPTVVGRADEPVRLGFDVLAPYFPRFDPAKGIMTLRRVDRRAPSTPGPRVPALYDSNGIRLLVGGRWQSSTAAGPAILLGTRRWLWDWKLGDVVLIP